MKKILLSLAAIFLLIGESALTELMADSTAPPPLKAAVALKKTSFSFCEEPIEIVLTLANISGAGIVTKSGFGSSPFHLFLTFIDPEGKPVVAQSLTAENDDTGDQPPPIIWVQDEPKQAEPVETLPGNWTLSVDIPKAQTYYNLPKYGEYSVKAAIPFVAYPAVNFTESQVNYSRLDSFTWAGTLYSGIATFSIKAGDLDHDGDVDTNDVNIVIAARNKPAAKPCDPKDLDGDGKITALDARKLALLCTRPKCAIK